MAQQQQGNSDNSLDGLLAVGCIFAVVIATWWFGRVYIVNASFFYWKIQLFFIGMFTNSFNGFVDFMNTTDIRSVDWGMYSLIGGKITSYTKWIAIAALVYMAKMVLDKDKTEKHKRFMMMDELAASEEKVWPQVAPLRKLGLAYVNSNEGPWASAMKNRQFAHHHKLFQEDDSINVEKATEVFIQQLDKPLTKLSKMNIQRKAAFALFAAKLCENDDLYKRMVRILAESTAAGKTDFSCIQEALKLYGKCEDKRLRKIVNAHAYELTMLTSLLQVARGAGILNDTDFLGWMKPQERLLWYTINQTGRRVAWAEAAGVRAHWLAEVITKRRLEDPMVDSAVNALVEACKETKDVDNDAPFKYRY